MQGVLFNFDHEPFSALLQIWWKYKIIVLLELINVITSCQQEYLMVETEMLLILNSIMMPVSKIVTMTSEYNISTGI